MSIYGKSVIADSSDQYLWVLKKTHQSGTVINALTNAMEVYHHQKSSLCTWSHLPLEVIDVFGRKSTGRVHTVYVICSWIKMLLVYKINIILVLPLSGGYVTVGK